MNKLLRKQRNSVGAEIINETGDVQKNFFWLLIWKFFSSFLFNGIAGNILAENFLCDFDILLYFAALNTVH